MTLKNKLAYSEFENYKNNSESFSRLPLNIQNILVSLTFEQIEELEIVSGKNYTGNFDHAYVKLLIAKLDNGERIKVSSISEKDMIARYSVSFYKDPLSVFGIETD